MIYTSHLLEDTQMQEVVRECATGIESIEFSIAENLQSSRTTLENGMAAFVPSRSVSGFESDDV